MAELIGIAGNSGSGKTTSVKDLNPIETFIISVLGKPLPFRGFKKNYPPLKVVDKNYVGNFFTSNKVDNIIKIFGIINKSRPEIKQIVIDDK
jgi:ABC-type dipeptide/oligopeptide/nickel transport system ATPase subunit